MIETPNEFKQVLADYIEVTSMSKAQAWIKEQQCSQGKKDDFIAMCRLALRDDISPYRYAKGQDYIDSCRRGYDI